MKLFKKILIGLLVVVILAIIAGYIYLRHLATRGIPDYKGCFGGECQLNDYLMRIYGIFFQKLCTLK